MTLTSSVSETELIIDPAICTAIIYSIDDLSVYSVEIRRNNESNFIKSGEDMELYQNIAKAKRAAKNHHAERCYIATSLTYEDIGGINSKKRRYDYQLISLLEE